MKKITLSIVITFVVTLVLTSATMFLGKGLMIPDGIYAVKSARIIELKGDAELPLYKEVVGNLNNIPNEITSISVSSNFGKYISGTKMCDLVYRYNEFNGDYFETLVVLKKGDWVESKYCGRSLKESVKKDFNINNRKEMIKLAVEQINEQN